MRLFEILQILRNPAETSADLSDLRLHIPNVEITALNVFFESSVVGAKLAEINVRKEYCISLLAIRRAGEIIINPPGKWTLNLAMK